MPGLWASILILIVQCWAQEAMTALGQESGALPPVWDPFFWKQVHRWFSCLPHAASSPAFPSSCFLAMPLLGFPTPRPEEEGEQHVSPQCALGGTPQGWDREPFVHPTSRKGEASRPFTVTATETCRDTGQHSWRLRPPQPPWPPLTFSWGPASPTSSLRHPL